MPGVLTGIFVGGGIPLVKTRFVYYSFLVKHVHIIVTRICTVSCIYHDHVDLNQLNSAEYDWTLSSTRDPPDSYLSTLSLSQLIMSLVSRYTGMSNSRVLYSHSADTKSASCVARRTLVRPQQGGLKASNSVK